MPYQPRRTWKIVTQPQSEPVTLAEAKANLSVDFTDDDSMIEDLIVAAREDAELFTRRGFITQTWDLFLECFPSNDFRDEIEIPISPLQSITSVKYLDNDGVQQTMSASDYIVDTSSEPARIRPAYNTSWPSTRDQMNAIEVRFVAGYGDATDVPKAIKAAINMHVAGLYEHREANTDIKVEDNPAASRLLWKHRVLESF